MVVTQRGSENSCCHEQGLKVGATKASSFLANGVGGMDCRRFDLGVTALLLESLGPSAGRVTFYPFLIMADSLPNHQLIQGEAKSSAFPGHMSHGHQESSMESPFQEHIEYTERH